MIKWNYNSKVFEPVFNYINTAPNTALTTSQTYTYYAYSYNNSIKPVWSNLTYIGVMEYFNCVAARSFDSVMIAVGQGINQIAYSSDNGITWTGVGTSLFSVGLTVTWHNNMWIAGGYGVNSLAYSYDGVIWQGMGKCGFDYVYTLTSNELAKVTPAINITHPVLALGDGTNNTIAYSNNDGLSWSGLGNSIFTTRGNHACWNGKMWVAVGSGTNSIAYSYDVIEWVGIGTSILSSGYRCYWNGSMWLILGTPISGGQNNVAYSYDGINWSLTYAGISNPLCYTEVSTQTAYPNGMHVIAGNGISASTDGITWTNQLNNSNFSFDNVNTLVYLTDHLPSVEYSKNTSATISSGYKNY
jgi:hypothetical protein